MKLKKLRDQVIVITGASSGIGLTTAEAAAAAGARVVLSSRNEPALHRAVDEIRRVGGSATYVVADVADAEAVEQIAAHAIRDYGGFDTWINNAGTGIYGKLTDTPIRDKRRVFDVNFWGVVHGCRAAIPHLRERGGAIVNLGSVADLAIPLLGIYSASKHAVKAYTDALRIELEKDGLPISVTLIKPSSVGTPFIEHARTYMDSEAEYPPPVYAPEEVARAILRCAETPIREVTVGGAGKLLRIMNTVAPRISDLYLRATQFRQMKRDVPADSTDSLYRPRADKRYGPTTRYILKRSAYTRAALSNAGRALPYIAGGAIVASAVLLGLSSAPRRRT